MAVGNLGIGDRPARLVTRPGAACPIGPHSPIEDPQTRRIEPTVVYRSDGNGTVRAFVAAGTVALVPELALDGRDERIVGVGPRRAPGAAPHRAGLASRASAEPGRRAFMELARSVCGPPGAASAA